ncbi:MAG: alkaline phosphatase family protein [Lentisphaerae bacterium]|nr:alkaline phosphatase family protein [Lentisphaerota bacterium]
MSFQRVRFGGVGTWGVCAAYLFLSVAPIGAAPEANVLGPVVGAVTSTSADFVVLLDQPAATVRVVISTNASRDVVVAAATATPSPASQAVRLHVAGLTPDTTYDYAVELNGRRLDSAAGRFRTFPVEGRPASFTFAFGNSLMKDRPETSGLVAAAQHDPLFFLNLGDMFYADIATNDPAVFRATYRKALGSRSQTALLRRSPLVYIWDDHDFGPNDSDKTAPGRAASRQVYQELIPHYPLAAGQGDVPIYQAFTVGRVRFIVTDLRSERDPMTANETTRSMMGAAQRAWFKQELATSAKSHGLVLWVSSVPWTGQPGTPFTDSWMAYTNERQQMADWVKTNGIHNLVIIAGDAHSTAADDGTHGDYATGGGAPIPTIIAAPLDNDHRSIKAGPYSQGAYAPTAGEENMFGLVTITDTGGPITLRFSGRNNRQEEKISLVYTVGTSAGDADERSALRSE